MELEELRKVKPATLLRFARISKNFTVTITFIHIGDAHWVERSRYGLSAGLGSRAVARKKR